MPIELSIALDEEKLPPNLPIVIFRIIQEALSNIVKHSGATRASVSLGMDGDASGSSSAMTERAFRSRKSSPT